MSRPMAETVGTGTFVSRMLAAQAMTMDAIFTGMARRMAISMGEYPGATESHADNPMQREPARLSLGRCGGGPGAWTAPLPDDCGF